VFGADKGSRRRELPLRTPYAAWCRFRWFSEVDSLRGFGCLAGANQFAIVTFSETPARSDRVLDSASGETLGAMTCVPELEGIDARHAQ
jgi:hypothetical protein